jgi:hypothetical protein
MEYSFNAVEAIEMIVVTLIFVFIVSMPVYFLYRVCNTADKVMRKLDSPKAKSAIKGIIALGGGFWALKQARTAKSDKERSFYMSLVDEAQHLAHEANNELEGNQSGKFYDNPDWWKKGGDDQEPPSSPRWQN